MGGEKVGIVSLYYQNYNYGGQLQAYALEKTINNMGYQCEQIQFQHFIPIEEKYSHLSLCQHIKVKLGELRKKPFKKKVSLFFRAFSNMVNIRMIITKKYLKQKIDRRISAIGGFANNQVAHSDTVYDVNTMNTSINLYDVFVCGSDQIWNSSFLSKEIICANCLQFVPEQKRKIAYAASFGKERIEQSEADYMMPLLARLNTVSVREQSAANIIKKELDKQVDVVLDPTFLLTRKMWEKVLVSPDVETPYLFCYFLGNNPSHRKAAKKFAKQKGLKIVAFPYPLGRFTFTDWGFGDYQNFDADPLEWIGLIKNAAYIMTDSFHAVVFSVIFEKDFVCFPRNKNTDPKAMNTRITGFLSELELDNLWMDSSLKECVDFPSYNRADVQKKVDQMQNLSMKFLFDALSLDKKKGTDN